MTELRMQPSGVDFDAELAHLRGHGPDPFAKPPASADTDAWRELARIFETCNGVTTSVQYLRRAAAELDAERAARLKAVAELDATRAELAALKEAEQTWNRAHCEACDKDEDTIAGLQLELAKVRAELAVARQSVELLRVEVAHERNSVQGIRAELARRKGGAT